MTSTSNRRISDVVLSAMNMVVEYSKDRPRPSIASGGKVREPVNPVSIWASIRARIPVGPRTATSIMASRSALTRPDIISEAGIRCVPLLGILFVRGGDGHLGGAADVALADSDRPFHRSHSRRNRHQ